VTIDDELGHSVVSPEWIWSIRWNQKATIAGLAKNKVAVGSYHYRPNWGS
jgi:hypothetical protein